jgi:hypothetical protein
MTKKVFKGIKQVSLAQFQAAKEANLLSGYLWFVRSEITTEGEEANDLNNDSYDIYFGSRQYGHFSAGELDAIRTRIETLEGDVAELLQMLTDLTGLVEGNAEAIKTNADAIAANVTAIENVDNKFLNYLVKNIDENDKVLNVADGILSSAISLSYENNRISLTGKDGVEIAGFDASEFVKDSVLEDVKVETKEDNEKYIVFTWKTEGEETKTDEIKVSDFAKLYNAGTALELAADGVTFNVKVATNGNFLSVNDSNELIVDDMTVDKTVLKEAITIEGGPLATDAVKGAFTGGVIPAGTDMQAVLKALLCVEIYPKPSSNTPDYSVSISAPSIGTPTGSSLVKVSNEYLAEVGTEISFGAITAKSVTVTKTNPQVSGFTHGYSAELEGENIVDATSISSEWTVNQIDGNVYELSATKSGFTGNLPATVQNASAASCTLSACKLTVASGTNTYTVTEDAPKHSGTHPGVASYYVVSNLGGRKEEEKSPAIASTETAVEKDPSSQSASFSVTGLYPIFTNGISASTTDATAAAMADLAAHVSGDGTKLSLMKANTAFAVSFAAHTKGVEGYRLYLPGSWTVKSAMGINANTAKFAVDQKDKFVALKDAEGNVLKVKRTIQGNEVDYTVYEYLATEGANRVKFTVG